MRRRGGVRHRKLKAGGDMLHSNGSRELAQAPAPGYARAVDFLFTGTAVVPAALMAGGAPGMALMVFCPLIIGACLAAAYLEGPAGDAQ
jgi:hypothetical protein